MFKNDIIQVLFLGIKENDIELIEKSIFQIKNLLIISKKYDSNFEEKINYFKICNENIIIKLMNKDNCNNINSDAKYISNFFKDSIIKN